MKSYIQPSPSSYFRNKINYISHVKHITLSKSWMFEIFKNNNKKKSNSLLPLHYNVIPIQKRKPKTISLLGNLSLFLLIAHMGRTKHRSLNHYPATFAKLSPKTIYKK